jgi:predicted RND superfamily exporter protein
MIYALKRTYISTGKAIILTTLILCGGFLTLVVSDFLSTFYLGLLISLTLFFAVLADLLILPLLLLWFYKPKSNLKRIK